MASRAQPADAVGQARLATPILLGAVELSTIHSMTLRVINLEELAENLVSYHRDQHVLRMAQTRR